MELLVTYEELQRLIESKTGRKLRLSKNEDGTLRVAYSLEISVPFLGKAQKEIYVNLSINRIDGDDLYLTYSSAKGLDMMLSGAKMFLGDIIERTNLLSWGDNEREVIVHINRVAQYASINNYHRLRELVIDPVIGIKDKGLQLSFGLRLN